MDDLKSSKKRKACGACGPCLKKENCGSCKNCLHRKTGHQICIYRKCIRLKKSNGNQNDYDTSDSLPSPGNTTHTVRNVSKKKKTIRDLVKGSGRCSSKAFAKKNQISRKIKKKRLQKMQSSKSVKKEHTDRREPDMMECDSSSMQTQRLYSQSERKKRKSRKTKSVSYAEEQHDHLDYNCQCQDEDGAPFYTQLGVAGSTEELREMLRDRFRIDESKLRVIEVEYTGVESKTSDGCPRAEWAIRRISKSEKLLALVHRRRGHTCKASVVLMAIVAWDGIHPDRANVLQDCHCQGTDNQREGAAFTLGNMYQTEDDGLKIILNASAYQLADSAKEQELAEALESLAADLAPVYKKFAPWAYNNQIKYQENCVGKSINEEKNGPFSGVICSLDFCAHNHVNTEGLDDGASMVCTLLKDPEDENVKNQLHIYPMYRPLSRSSTTNINDDSILSPYDMSEIVGNGLGDSTSFLQNSGIDEFESALPAGIERVHTTLDSDSAIGIGTSGIGLTLPHGSLLIECSSKEVRATTPIQSPDRSHPQRITMTFFHHKTLKASQRELLRQKEIKFRNQQHLYNNTGKTPLRAHTSGNNPLNYGNTSFPSSMKRSVGPYPTTDSKFRIFDLNHRNQVLTGLTTNQQAISSTDNTTTCDNIKIYTRGIFTLPTSTNTLVKSIGDTKPVVSGPYQRWFRP
ncbi:uncharacterized protein TRIADDRAFT_52488 [Trichoplax adhaerens]|uniref:Methylcytosine dioxygenase TET n=1 Tax=Trichoplax adhaerens TaxID=10228 RepID=B3RIQ4_TRIAD|nr:hypothetical protein TRIADDRAFT_52488 [Trichoplax adhaerens]EDV29763.1 hypothetical protein TRIADDRAFT_52488 [Trichoplax adhaerens]|eukprot:XP_002108965.1 hypothetical protein TRIADDRAFT_52488 [Trichoplax adhaerens]